MLLVSRVVASAAFRAVIAASVVAASFAYGARGNAADLFSPISVAEQSDASSRPNSVLVFAGRMSATDIYSTSLLNYNKDGGGSGRTFDNFIAGAAYDRDLFNLGYGFYFGVEVGLADRYGNYKVCCDTIVQSSSIVQSAELWAGPQIRYAGILLFDLVRIGGGVTFGLSAVTASIGRELEREIQGPANARLLLYLGPELDFSTPRIPNFEFVLKLQHRSGAGGTLGHMDEGYNGDVVGVRYRF